MSSGYDTWVAGAPQTAAGGESMLPLAGATLASGVLSAIGGANAQAASAKSAQDQMDFQYRMATTQHQREVEDLKKAGLNPILSANKGADVPGGASFQAVNNLEGAASAIQATGMKKADQDYGQALMASQTENQQAQAGSAKAAANLSNAQAQATNLKNPVEVRKILIDTGISKKDLEHYDKKMYMDMGTKGLSAAANTVGAIGSVLPIGGAAKAAKGGVDKAVQATDKILNKFKNNVPYRGPNSEK